MKNLAFNSWYHWQIQGGSVPFIHTIPGIYLRGYRRSVINVLESKRNIEISDKLSINQKTVNTYITRIMKKLEVSNKTDLYLLARKHIKQPY